VAGLPVTVTGPRPGPTARGLVGPGGLGLAGPGTPSPACGRCVGTPGVAAASDSDSESDSESEALPRPPPGRAQALARGPAGPPPARARAPAPLRPYRRDGASHGHGAWPGACPASGTLALAG
jgi:hypothetical protein